MIAWQTNMDLLSHTELEEEKHNFWIISALHVITILMESTGVQQGTTRVQQGTQVQQGTLPVILCTPAAQEVLMGASLVYEAVHLYKLVIVQVEFYNIKSQNN